MAKTVSGPLRAAGAPRAPKGSKNVRESFFVILGSKAFQKDPNLNLSNKSQPDYKVPYTKT